MFSANIEKATIKNRNYRRVLYTDSKQQLVLMSLEPGEFIPAESHNGTQFFRIEQGSGRATVGAGRTSKNISLNDGVSLIVPSNTTHFIKNTSSEPLKLYSIYSPPQHARKALNRRQPVK